MREAPGNWEVELSLTKFLQDMVNNKILPIGGHALIIGSGKTARNVRSTMSVGLKTIAIDISHECLANYHKSWQEYEPPHKFDVIIDIKSLCHSPDPMLQKVKDTLKPSGIFYSMMPTFRHLKGEPFFPVGKGKSFTRMPTFEEIHEMFKIFAGFIAREEVAPIGRVGILSTWAVEAYMSRKKIFVD